MVQVQAYCREGFLDLSGSQGLILTANYPQIGARETRESGLFER